MRPVVKKPFKSQLVVEYPPDDRILIVLDLIVEYGKFYREWKIRNAEKLAKTAKNND
jgi:hypothetical protein